MDAPIANSFLRTQFNTVREESDPNAWGSTMLSMASIAVTVPGGTQLMRRDWEGEFQCLWITKARC